MTEQEQQEALEALEALIVERLAGAGHRARPLGPAVHPRSASGGAVRGGL